MMQPHILLITLDSLRADHVSCHGRSPVDTPALDRFAASGVRFAQHLSSVSATLTSHASLMTGCTPMVHGVTWNGVTTPRRRRTVAELAAGAGYRTSAITSWGGFQSQQVYGFQYVHSEGRAAELENRGERTLERVRQWLEQADPDQPQLLWVHFIDPHSPDISPPPYPATYAGSVAFTDMVVGKLLEAWDLRLGAQRTIAAITADHGEHLDDHGVVRGHGTLWEVCLHVPLLIRAPGLIPAAKLDPAVPPATGQSGPGHLPAASSADGQVVSELTRQIDVMPTLLDYAAIPMPHNVEGMSLRGLIEGTDRDLHLVHHGQAIRDGIYTATVRNAEYAMHFGDGKNLAGLYDRRADPQETNNLVDRGAVVRHSEAHSLADARL